MPIAGIREKQHKEVKRCGFTDKVQANYFIMVKWLRKVIRVE